MQQYIARRALLIIPTMFLVSIFVFGMVRILPGDVVLAQLFDAPQFRPEDEARLREELGLNKPAPVQYVEWIGGVLRGDLGNSLWTGRDVMGEIWKRMPVTFELAIMTFILSQMIALTVGVVSAIRQDSAIDYFLRVFAIGGLSIPFFWIATLVIVLGARYFGYLPPLVYQSFMDNPLGNLQQFIVPAAILAFGGSATTMRMMRSSMLEILRQDFIRTAWSKGLRERQVIYRHTLRNAFLPVVTLMGAQISFLLTGSLIAEIIFNLPGTGRLAYDAVINRDYTMIQGIVLVFGTLFVVINLVVDLIYAWLDPRIRY
jgi:peptide/nickel transport system permease protein